MSWINDPTDLRYRAGESVVKAIPVLLAFVVVSGVAQYHTNTTFDANEIHNLAEGGGAMAALYAALRFTRMV